MIRAAPIIFGICCLSILVKDSHFYIHENYKNDLLSSHSRSDWMIPASIRNRPNRENVLTE